VKLVWHRWIEDDEEQVGQTFRDGDVPPESLLMDERGNILASVVQSGRRKPVWDIHLQDSPPITARSYEDALYIAEALVVRDLGRCEGIDFAAVVQRLRALVDQFRAVLELVDGAEEASE
jgi:hypothetical protein